MCHFIDALIVNNIETTTLARFTSYLKMVLPGVDPQIMILAAKALGKIWSLTISKFQKILNFAQH